MKVRATNKYQELNIKDKELNKIPKAGEEWNITKKRFEVLNGKNKFKTIFVEEVKEENGKKKNNENRK